MNANFELEDENNLNVLQDGDVLLNIATDDYSFRAERSDDNTLLASEENFGKIIKIAGGNNNRIAQREEEEEEEEEKIKTSEPITTRFTQGEDEEEKIETDIDIQTTRTERLNERMSGNSHQIRWMGLVMVLCFVCSLVFYYFA